MKEAELKKDEATETVADLQVNSEEAEQIEAGSGQVSSFLAFPGFTGGVHVGAAD